MTMSTSAADHARSIGIVVTHPLAASAGQCARYFEYSWYTYTGSVVISPPNRFAFVETMYPDVMSSGGATDPSNPLSVPGPTRIANI